MRQIIVAPANFLLCCFPKKFYLQTGWKGVCDRSSDLEPRNVSSWDSLLLHPQKIISHFVKAQLVIPVTSSSWIVPALWYFCSVDDTFFVGKWKLKHQTRFGLVCWLHGKICSVIMHSKFKVCVKISGAMSIQVPVLWICTSSSYTCMYDIIQRRCSLILSIIKRVTTSLLHFRIQVLQSHLCLQTKWISDHIGIF